MPQFNDPAYRSFVLIATYGRSGSTVLQSLLGQLPGWCIRAENYHALHGLYLSAQASRRMKMDFGRKPLRPDNPWYGAFDADPDAYGRALASEFVDHILRPPPTAHVVGFKEIRVFHRIDQAADLFDFVLNSFEPARIVFLRRSWQAVSRSGWWPALDPDDVRSYIQRCDAVMDDFVHRKPDQSMVVRYSDLVDQRENIRGLFSFLNAEFDSEQLDAVLSRHLNHGVTVRERALAGLVDLTEVATLVEGTHAPQNILVRWKDAIARRLALGIHPG